MFFYLIIFSARIISIFYLLAFFSLNPSFQLVKPSAISLNRLALGFFQFSQEKALLFLSVVWFFLDQTCSELN